MIKTVMSLHDSHVNVRLFKIARIPTAILFKFTEE